MEKAAIFSCRGMGDGLIFLVLANNLRRDGYDVTFYHDGNIRDLAAWFPWVSIKSFKEAPKNVLESFSKIFISYDSASSFIKELILSGRERRGESIFVMNPSISKTPKDSHGDFFFNREISIVDNLFYFCRDILKVKNPTKANGIEIPKKLIYRKNRKDIIIHPTSATKGRRWKKSKFLKLASHLEAKGFFPKFIVAPDEIFMWHNQGFDVMAYLSFDGVARLIYESGYFIGNDSGIGHLASNLGLRVLSIARSKRTMGLWRPGWEYAAIITPSSLIPNIKGFRLRDKRWQNFISVRRVCQVFFEDVLIFDQN